jgi:hypothetical protein
MSLTERQLETRRKRNARGLDEVVLDCRLTGHHWIRVNDTSPTAPLFGVRICYECSRCSSGRCDLVQRATGGLLHRSYTYADGYHLESIDGDRPVNADTLRFETIRRIDEHLTIPGVPAIGSAPTTEEAS